MTSVYLAASCSRKEDMRGVRIFLSEFGYEVTSRWIDSEKPGMSAEDIRNDPDMATTGASLDMMDIVMSDIFVLFTDEPSTTGGRHVELGLAIATSKHIVVVGELENIFQSGLMQFRTFPEFTEYVRGINAASQAGTDRQKAFSSN